MKQRIHILGASGSGTTTIAQNVCRHLNYKHFDYERYVDRILLGGDRYKNSKDFIEWAAAYDSGTRNGRSLSKHKAWLTAVKCPVIEVINYDLENSVEQVMNSIEK